MQATDRDGTPVFYRARLSEPYVFYARGERWTGDRIAPGLERINAEEGKVFLRALGRQRRYEVGYNPLDPADNYLTVGSALLPNWKLLLYAALGVGLPLLLYLLAGPRDLLVAGLTLAFLLVFGALYYTLQPILNLGELLTPTPDREDNPEEELPAGDLLEDLARAARRRQKVAVKEASLRGR